MTTYIPSLTLPSFIFASPAASILLPVTLGGIIGYTTRPAVSSTHPHLAQPPFYPPRPLFGPIWLVLYALTGYASHHAYTSAFPPSLPFPLYSALTPTQRVTLHGCTLYTLQLALNLAWMPLFFGARAPRAAVLDILALGGVAGYLAVGIWREVDEVAAGLMGVYLGWVGFATYLCVGVGWMNGWDLGRGGEVKKGE